MNIRKTASCGMLAAILSVPGIASASFILDTGAPTSTAGASTLSPAQWLAAEFTVGPGDTITSLSADLAQLNGQTSTAFTFDIYSGATFLTSRASAQTPVVSIAGTYTASGWNSSGAINYNLAPGTYWLALEMTSTGGRGVQGLSAPGAGLSTSSGTAPALAFAYLGSATNGDFTTAGALPVGLEVTAVPLPPALWLLGSGVLGLGVMVRRRLSGVGA